MGLFGNTSKKIKEKIGNVITEQTKEELRSVWKDHKWEIIGGAFLLGGAMYLHHENTRMISAMREESLRQINHRDLATRYAQYYQGRMLEVGRTPEQITELREVYNAACAGNSRVEPHFGPMSMMGGMGGIGSTTSFPTLPNV